MISDNIVDSRKRVAVSNGKITPGEDGTEFDLDMDSDEIEIEMPEEKEFAHERDYSDDEFPTGGAIMSMGDWDTGIDGGKFGIGSSFSGDTFMAELEGTTPAIMVELEGSSVPVEAEADSPVLEKAVDSDIAEKEGETPITDRSVQNWGPITPLKQVRHVGHLVKDTPPPTRETSMASSISRRGGTVKAEAERFITPLFSPVSPMERGDPMDQTNRESIATVGTTRSLGSLLERNRRPERLTPKSSADRVSLPMRQSSPTHSVTSTRSIPRPSTGRVPSPLQENKPTTPADPTRSMESLATPTPLSPTRYTPQASPSRAQHPSPERLKASSPSPLPHERRRAGTMPNSNRPAPPLEQHPMFAARTNSPGEIVPRTNSPGQMTPRTSSPEQFSSPAPVTKRQESITSPLWEKPQSLLEIDLDAASPLNSYKNLSASAKSQIYRPLTLSDRGRAETLPIIMARPAVTKIKRKQVPVRQDSVGAAFDSDLARRQQVHSDGEGSSRREAPSRKDSKARAAAFLQRQRPIVETEDEDDSEDREMTEEERKKLVRRTMTRRNSEGSSWLSL